MPPARSVLVSMAAARGRDRGQHRRRLSALQQVVQLFLFGPRSVRKPPMRKLLFESLFRRPLTERAPSPDDAARGGARNRSRPAPRGGGSAEACRSARSMPGPATDANSRFMRSTTPIYDVERFGIRFVASPRHADVLMVTGPVTKNMREALERTYPRDPRTRNGSSRSEIARGTEDVLPAATRSSAGSPKSSRSICTFPAARLPPPMLQGLLALLERVDAGAVPS